jgi:acyl-CoA synthetase (AMP-forming)/AMP-acid ligase II
MGATAVQYEAEKILSELPDRISDIIKPFVRRSPDHPALVQGDVTWTYAELAAVVADTTLILEHYDIRPGNEEVVAYVELLPGSAATPADLMAHAARLLAPYKHPSEIIVVDALPAASTGKILKHRLADAARDRAIARV